MLVFRMGGRITVKMRRVAAAVWMGTAMFMLSALCFAQSAQDPTSRYMESIRHDPGLLLALGLISLGAASMYGFLSTPRQPLDPNAPENIALQVK